MPADEQSRLKSIVETAVDAIITIDDRGVIDTFNRAAERIFSYTADEVIGKNVSLLMPNPYRDEHASYLGSYLATGVKKIIGVGREVVGRRKDGTTFPMRLVVGQFSLDGRRVFTGMVHDLTEQKRAEERALQSERLAAMSQILAALTHESRNILQLTQINLELLGAEVEDRPQALAYVSKIQQAQDQLQQLYRDLRDFAAPLLLDREICNLDHLVGHALNEITPLYKDRKIRLRKKSGIADCRCSADPFRLGQVFHNLLETSIAACPGLVVIEEQWSEANLDGRPALRLSLSDNGPGVPAEHSVKVFEPFFTTRSKGSGLGLAITKRIVEAHGGQISVGNNGSTGAEFLITLPRDSSVT